MRRLSIWLLACMGWCIVWTLPAQASWEAYQEAGEAAYSRGDYTTAQRMFLAAVREARHFGPQDPRLDISLSKLALLRIAQDAQSRASIHTRRVTRSKSHVRKPGITRRGHQRQAARPVLRHTRSGRQHHALRSARPGERRKGTRTTLTRQARPAKRSRAILNRASSVRRAAPPARHAKRRATMRAPRRQRGHTLQRSHTTRHHAGTTAGRRSPTRSRQE
jgi:hypothetical protein